MFLIVLLVARWRRWPFLEFVAQLIKDVAALHIKLGLLVHVLLLVRLIILGLLLLILVRRVILRLFEGLLLRLLLLFWLLHLLVLPHRVFLVDISFVLVIILVM